MAMYKRGNVWWYEIKLPTRRIQTSTGLKDRQQAEKVYRAALIGAKDGAEKSMVERMLSKIFAEANRMAISDVWPKYMAWYNAKGKSITPKTLSLRKGRVDAMIQWMSKNRIVYMDQLNVEIARKYVASLDGANKTVRLKTKDLSTVWSACAQEIPGLHNPWTAACPDDDGSAEIREPFTADEQSRILVAAKEIGHEWYGVCMVGKWTMQRYGDCATLEWGRIEEAKKKKTLERGVVDLDAGIIVLDPQKTRRHGTRLFIPIADPLASYLRTMPRSKTGLLFEEHEKYYTAGKNKTPIPFPVPFADVLTRAKVALENHTFHSWRHTLRSLMADVGVTDATANRFGGWTGVKMGAHYDHSMHLDEMRMALEKVAEKNKSSESQILRAKVWRLRGESNSQPMV